MGAMSSADSKPGAATSGGHPLVGIVTGRLTGGGLGNVALDLANGLAGLGVSVDLLALAGRTEPPARSLHPRVGVRSLGVKRARWSVIPLSRYLREQRPAALISVGWIFNGPAVVAGMLARYGRVITTEHVVLSNQTRSEYATFRTARMVDRVARLLYPRAAGLVAVSEAVLADLRQEVGVALQRGRARAIRNPVDTRQVRALAKSGSIDPALRTRERPWFVNVGRLVREKNQTLLVEAFAEARRRIGSGSLFIVGEGPERARIEERINGLGVSRHVHLLGECRNPFPYVMAADAFVLTSRTEGFSLVLVEAMALETPVVCAACDGGAREILGSRPAGLWIEPASPTTVARAMQRVVTDGALADELRARGRERASAYEPSAVAEEWIEFLGQLGVLAPPSGRIYRSTTGPLTG